MLLQVTFDPGIILQYMDSLPTNKQPIIHGSSHKKICTLLCLLSQQHSQTISSLKVDRSVLAHGTYILSTSIQFKKQQDQGDINPLWLFSHLNPMRNFV